MGVFKGKDVAVKTLRVSSRNDKAKIRRVRKRAARFPPGCSYIVQHFCKEVSVWKNLSHPNVINLIGISDTLEEGRFSMVTEWMANGNIVGYIRNNSGNHLRLVGHNHISFATY